MALLEAEGFSNLALWGHLWGIIRPMCSERKVGGSVKEQK